MTGVKIAVAVMFTGLLISLLSTSLGAGLVFTLLVGLFA